MTTEHGSGKAFRFVQIFDIVLYYCGFVMADALYRMPVTDGFPGDRVKLFPPENIDNNTITLAIYGLTSGYFFSKVYISQKINPTPCTIKYLLFINTSVCGKNSTKRLFMLTMMGVAVAALGW